MINVIIWFDLGMRFTKGKLLKIIFCSGIYTEIEIAYSPAKKFYVLLF